MGDEPFYTDRLCDAIVENALDEEERDFNETICYGSDVDADTVITAARRFPMMAERQLVVVKEAQAMRDLEKVAVYLEQPLDSTILVLLLRGASADKRKSLYKLASKTGVVFESKALRDYEMPAWISAYFSGRGMRIAPDAAALLAEYAGTDMSKIVLEADKLARNLPEGGGEVRSADIEAQVGISRTVSIFELTRELSLKNGPKALNLAARIGAAPRFAMPMAVSALYTHFNRILRYAALKERNRYPDKSAVAAVLQGVNPYFWKEYDAAVANYPIRRLIGIISLLCEYDYKGKGGDAGETLPGDLLVELVAKILS
jgi:DNA polymerase-3 subunit delta